MFIFSRKAPILNAKFVFDSFCFNHFFIRLKLYFSDDFRFLFQYTYYVRKSSNKWGITSILQDFAYYFFIVFICWFCVATRTKTTKHLSLCHWNLLVYLHTNSLTLALISLVMLQKNVLFHVCQSHTRFYYFLRW